MLRPMTRLALWVLIPVELFPRKINDDEVDPAVAIEVAAETREAGGVVFAAVVRTADRIAAMQPQVWCARDCRSHFVASKRRAGRRHRDLFIPHIAGKDIHLAVFVDVAD